MAYLRQVLLILLSLELRLGGAVSFPDCSPQADGHVPFNGTGLGPFGRSLAQINASYEGSPLVVLHPSKADLPKEATAGFPLIVFMHGSTAQIEMYQPNLEFYASQGFVIVFPYIKGPSADTSPLTLNTNGKYIEHGIRYASEQAANLSSPLHGLVDMSSVVIAGHSMGATCSIQAGHSEADPGVAKIAGIKLVVTQHPGICGPFGPPPLPSTWMPSDLRKTAAVAPLLFTTATNDGAFWPAPHTAEHELGCFQKTDLDHGPNPATFVQFTEGACLKDDARLPFDDSGHNCPFKIGVETPWVLTAMKLYAQQGGRSTSRCASMLYGSGDDSLTKDPQVKTSFTRFNSSMEARPGADQAIVSVWV